MISSGVANGIALFRSLQKKKKKKKSTSDYSHTV